MQPKRTRPETTLFLNLSVDGRITSHDSDEFDTDKHWKEQPGIRGILQQFYEFNEPGMCALTIGSFMKHLGVNSRQAAAKKQDISLVLLDPDADLTYSGVRYLSYNVNRLYLVSLPHHPYLKKTAKPIANVTPITSKTEIDLVELFKLLYHKHHIGHLFIHSIAPLNADLLDTNLIDHLSVVISPLLVGGHGIPALMDKGLFSVRPLQLVSVQTFDQNYINLRYNVLNI